MHPRAQAPRGPAAALMLGALKDPVSRPRSPGPGSAMTTPIQKACSELSRPALTTPQRALPPSRGHVPASGAWWGGTAMSIATRPQPCHAAAAPTGRGQSHPAAAHAAAPRGPRGSSRALAWPQAAGLEPAGAGAAGLRRGAGTEAAAGSPPRAGSRLSSLKNHVS